MGGCGGSCCCCGDGGGGCCWANKAGSGFTLISGEISTVVGGGIMGLCLTTGLTLPRLLATLPMPLVLELLQILLELLVLLFLVSLPLLFG